MFNSINLLEGGPDGLSRRTAAYYGETGKSGAYRVQKGHQDDIKNKNIKNALAKHLANDHPVMLITSSTVALNTTNPAFRGSH